MDMPIPIVIFFVALAVAACLIGWGIWQLLKGYAVRFGGVGSMVEIGVKRFIGLALVLVVLVLVAVFFLQVIYAITALGAVALLIVVFIVAGSMAVGVTRGALLKPEKTEEKRTEADQV